MYPDANEVMKLALGEMHPSFALTLGNIANLSKDTFEAWQICGGKRSS